MKQRFMPVLRQELCSRQCGLSDTKLRQGLCPRQLAGISSSTAACQFYAISKIESIAFNFAQDARCSKENF